MSKEKFFRMAIDVVIIIIGIVFLVFGIRDAVATFKAMNISDAEKFNRSYSDVKSSESLYEYITLDKLKKIDEDAFVLIGSPKNAWMQVVAKPLNEVAKERSYKLYYLETEAMKEEDIAYKDLLDFLGKKTLDMPVIVVFNDKSKKVYDKSDLISSDYMGAPIDYFKDDTLTDFKTVLQN